MRVAVVAHSKSGWTPRFCRSFAERGDEVLLLTFSPDALPPDIQVRSEFVGIEPFDPTTNKWMFLTRVPRIRRALRAFNPDVVLAPYLSSCGLSAVLSWSGPTVVCAVGSDVLSPHISNPILKLLRGWSIRLVGSRAAAINAVSTQLAEEMIRLGCPAEKIFVLPFGADLTGFHPAEDSPRGDASRLICTRRHDVVYNIPTVLDALSLLLQRGVRFHCVFTSGGTLLEQHRNRARDLGLAQVTEFTGELSTGELPDLLRRCDVYISASQSDGTSVALLEAMATGLFPVVSDIPANRPWIEPGRTGLLFDTMDAAALAAALERAMSDGRMRREAFSINRQRVQESGDWNRNLERLAERMEALIAERQLRTGQGIHSPRQV